MKQKLKSIETNEKGEVTSFFGFHVCDNAENQERFVHFENLSLILHIDEEPPINVHIDWFDHFWGKEVSENEIWSYLLDECRKYTHFPIFIDKFYVDECYSPLAESVRPKTDEEIKKEKEQTQLDFFFDSLEGED